MCIRDRIEADNLFKNSFPKILTVARLDRRKNHQNILMCIRNLKEKFPKIKYISIGDGEEKNNLLRLRKELKIEKEVIFLNKADQKLKNALIKNARDAINESEIASRKIEVLTRISHGEILETNQSTTVCKISVIDNGPGISELTSNSINSGSSSDQLLIVEDAKIACCMIGISFSFSGIV